VRRSLFTDCDHILRWAWSADTPRRRDMLRRKADPAHRHLTFVQLRSPRQAERWLATVAGGNEPG
jgi:hypothetical protein